MATSPAPATDREALGLAKAYMRMAAELARLDAERPTTAAQPADGDRPTANHEGGTDAQH